MEITKDEFKEIFNIDKKSKVSSDILRIYNKQIKGAYLLYKEVLKISEKKFKNVDGTQLKASFEPFSHGFKPFITTYGSKSSFHVSYMDEGRDRPTPFWTYTKYSDEEKVVIKNSAYKIFIYTVLNKLRYKYSKYNIDFEYRDYATTNRCHPNNAIWWDEVIFQPLFYLDPEGNVKEIRNHTIQESICNRSGIWYGDIPDPIRRVMNEIDEKEKKKLKKA